MPGGFLKKLGTASCGITGVVAFAFAGPALAPGCAITGAALNRKPAANRIQAEHLRVRIVTPPTDARIVAAARTALDNSVTKLRHPLTPGARDLALRSCSSPRFERGVAMLAVARLVLLSTCVFFAALLPAFAQQRGSISGKSARSGWPGPARRHRRRHQHRHRVHREVDHRRRPAPTRCRTSSRAPTTWPSRWPASATPRRTGMVLARRARRSRSS